MTPLYPAARSMVTLMPRCPVKLTTRIRLSLSKVVPPVSSDPVTKIRGPLQAACFELATLEANVQECLSVRLRLNNFK